MNNPHIDPVTFEVVAAALTAAQVQAPQPHDAQAWVDQALARNPDMLVSYFKEFDLDDLGLEVGAALAEAGEDDR